MWRDEGWVREFGMPLTIALADVQIGFEDAQRDAAFAQALRRHMAGGQHLSSDVLGQVLLARRMGKGRIIAVSDGEALGLATAIAGAAVGLPVQIYMGVKDIDRQQRSVERMALAGASIHAVQGGVESLSEALSVAMREWTAQADDSFHCFGVVTGPYPYPCMRDHFRSIWTAGAPNRAGRPGH